MLKELCRIALWSSYEVLGGSMWLNSSNIDLYLVGMAMSLFIARLNGFKVVQVGRNWEVSRLY